LSCSGTPCIGNSSFRDSNDESIGEEEPLSRTIDVDCFSDLAACVFPALFVLLLPEHENAQNITNIRLKDNNLFILRDLSVSLHLNNILP